MARVTGQAITTRYHGPTDFKGSRISATCQAGRISIDYPHELDHDKAHAYAAQLLADKLGWNTPRFGEWVGGGTLDGRGYAFVMTAPE